MELRPEPRLGAEWVGGAAPSLGVSVDTDHDQRAEDHPGQSRPFGARQAARQREPSLQDDGLLARQLLPLQGALRRRWGAGLAGADAAQADSGEPDAAGRRGGATRLV